MLANAAADSDVDCFDVSASLNLLASSLNLPCMSLMSASLATLTVSVLVVCLAASLWGLVASPKTCHDVLYSDKSACKFWSSQWSIHVHLNGGLYDQGLESSTQSRLLERLSLPARC